MPARFDLCRNRDLLRNITDSASSGTATPSYSAPCATPVCTAGSIANWVPGFTSVASWTTRLLQALTGSSTTRQFPDMMN